MSIRFVKNWPCLLAIAIVLTLLLPAIRHSSATTEDPAGIFATLPILHNGRMKPWDSFARETLLSLRGKQSFRSPDPRSPGSASEWLATVFFEPDQANQLDVFRVDHADLKTMLHTEGEEKKFYSYVDLLPYFPTIETQARLSDPDPKKRDAFQKAVISLHRKLVTYQSLLSTFDPVFSSPDRQQAYEEYVQVFLSPNPVDGNPDPTTLPTTIKVELEASLPGDIPRFIPNPNVPAVWYALADSWISLEKNPATAPLLKAYLEISDTWSTADVHERKERLMLLESEIRAMLPSSSLQKVSVETVFNRIQPFYLSIELYLLIFLLVMLGWFFISRKTLSMAFWLLAFAFLLHSAAIWVRMWLMGRPPVTNLYSSAVFVGWGSVGLGLLLEWLYKNGVGSVMAAVTGLLSLIIAQHLMEMGDTMEMMRAVLDSNFWLTTHVITVTFGYSATFVAGFLAIAFLLLGICTTRLTEELRHTLDRMVYGMVCFALFFSFIGTFTGGIWADQSWGRFWGWDPKENGALLIVVWNAVILHAKRGPPDRHHRHDAMRLFLETW